MTRNLYVVGVGGSGTKVQHTIHRAAEVLDDGDDHPDVTQIALDTGSIAQTDLPGDVTRLAIDNHATSRERPDGRKKLEKHISKINRSLKANIHEDLKGTDVDEAVIIVMAGLGGGTGSSAAIPMGALCKKHADMIDNDLSIDVRVVGAMTIPRLQPTTHFGGIPNGQKHLNAHAALRELFSVQTEIDATPEKLELPVDSTSRNSPHSLRLGDHNDIDNENDIDLPLYDALFLVPLDEDDVTSDLERDEAQDQAEAVNWTLAHLVLTLGLANLSNGIENLFDTTNGALKESVYTADFADVQVPENELIDFLDKKDDWQSTAEELDIDTTDYADLDKISEKVSSSREDLLKTLQHGEVTDIHPARAGKSQPSEELCGELEQLQGEIADDGEIDSLITERNFYKAVLSCDSDAGKIPEDLTTAPKPLSTLASNFEDWLGQVDYETIEFTEIKDQLQESVHKVPSSGEIKNGRAVARVALAKMAHAKFQSLKENHSFNQEIADRWPQWRDSALEIAPGVENASDKIKYTRGIRPAINNKITEKRSKKEEIPKVRFRKRGKLEAEIEELEEILEELNRKYDQVTTYESLKVGVKSKLLTPAEEDLKDACQSLTTQIENLRNKKRQSRRRISRLESEIENHLSNISSAETSQIERVPIGGSLDGLTRDTLEDADSIQDLLDKGILDENDLTELLIDTLKDLGQPLGSGSQDQRQNATLLVTLTDQNNNQVNSLNPGDAGNVSDTRTTEFSAETELSVGHVDRPFALGYLSISRGVDITTIPEYEWVNQKRQQEAGIQHYFDGISRKRCLSKYVAWPEVLNGEETETGPSPRPQTSRGSVTDGGESR